MPITQVTVKLHTACPNADDDDGKSGTPFILRRYSKFLFSVLEYHCFVVADNTYVDPVFTMPCIEKITHAINVQDLI